MSLEPVTVYFDYLCPFSWRVAELAEMIATPLGLDFQWQHFSLYQSNYKGDKHWQLWNDKFELESDNGSKGLLPFLASQAARRQGHANFQTFRLALMRSCHRDHQRYTMNVILETAERVGLHMPTFENDIRDPECRTALAREHHQAAELNVFGTPTLHFDREVNNGNGSNQLAYLRIREIPTSFEEAKDLFQTYRHLLTHHPYLETIRRPRPRSN
ncbi:MAG: DsbA family protein [Deinococcota bacterium]